MSVYRVSFMTKKGGIKDYVCDVTAKNKSEAITNVSEKWYKNNTAHAFQMNASKIDKPVYDEICILN